MKREESSNPKAMRALRPSKLFAGAGFEGCDMWGDEDKKLFARFMFSSV
jgi:hypothetical protein